VLPPAPVGVGGIDVPLADGTTRRRRAA